MNLNKTMAAVESRDERLQQAIDDAVLAADEADTAARYATTFCDVVEAMAENFTQIDKRIFERALRQGDKQSIGLMLALVQEQFDNLVTAKKREILDGGPF